MWVYIEMMTIALRNGGLLGPSKPCAAIHLMLVLSIEWRKKMLASIGVCTDIYWLVRSSSGDTSATVATNFFCDFCFLQGTNTGYDGSQKPNIAGVQ
jgi:hypothetical protein